VFNFWHGFAAVGILTAILYLFFYAVRLIAYLIISAGLYRMAQKRELPNPWLAWIPIARLYILGTLLRQVLAVTPQWRIPYIQIVLPLSAAFMLLGSGSFLGGLFTVITYILMVLAFSSLFRQYKEFHAVAYGILAGIPFLEIVGCFLVYRLSDLPVPDQDCDATVFP